MGWSEYSTQLPGKASSVGICNVKCVGSIGNFASPGMKFFMHFLKNVALYEPSRKHHDGEFFFPLYLLFLFLHALLHNFSLFSFRQRNQTNLLVQKLPLRLWRVLKYVSHKIHSSSVSKALVLAPHLSPTRSAMGAINMFGKHQSSHDLFVFVQHGTMPERENFRAKYSQ